jgi:hypothetical protein
MMGVCAMSDAADRVNAAIDAILNTDDPTETARLVAAAKSIAAVEVNDLEDTIAENEDRIEELKGEADGKKGEVADAVHRLLDEVQRPVGTQQFIVPKCGAVDRALLGLHDAIGRGL